MPNVSIPKINTKVTPPKIGGGLPMPQIKQPTINTSIYTKIPKYIPKNNYKYGSYPDAVLPEGNVVDYNNSEQVNSLLDVLAFGIMGKSSGLKPTTTDGDSATDRFKVAGEWLTRNYIKPIASGDFKAVGLNFLQGLGEDLDITSLPVKWLLYKAGVPGIKVSEGSGRHNYDMNTGFWLTDILCEVIIDPVNWITFGAPAISKQLTKAGTKAAKEVTETIIKKFRKIGIKTLSTEFIEDRVKNISAAFVKGSMDDVTQQVTKLAKDGVRHGIFEATEAAVNVQDALLQYIKPDNLKEIQTMFKTHKGMNALSTIYKTTDITEKVLLNATSAGTFHITNKLITKGLGTTFTAFQKFNINKKLKKATLSDFTVNIFDTKPIEDTLNEVKLENDYIKILTGHTGESVNKSEITEALIKHTIYTDVLNMSEIYLNRIITDVKSVSKNSSEFFQNTVDIWKYLDDYLKLKYGSNVDFKMFLEKTKEFNDVYKTFDDVLKQLEDLENTIKDTETYYKNSITYEAYDEAELFTVSLVKKLKEKETKQIIAGLKNIDFDTLYDEIAYLQKISELDSALDLKLIRELDSLVDSNPILKNFFKRSGLARTKETYNALLKLLTNEALFVDDLKLPFEDFKRYAKIYNTKEHDAFYKFIDEYLEPLASKYKNLYKENTKNYLKTFENVKFIFSIMGIEGDSKVFKIIKNIKNTEHLKNIFYKKVFQDLGFDLKELKHLQDVVSKLNDIEANSEIAHIYKAKGEQFVEAEVLSNFNNKVNIFNIVDDVELLNELVVYFKSRKEYTKHKINKVKLKNVFDDIEDILKMSTGKDNLKSSDVVNFIVENVKSIKNKISSEQRAYIKEKSSIEIFENKNTLKKFEELITTVLQKFNSESIFKELNDDFYRKNFPNDDYRLSKDLFERHLNDFLEAFKTVQTSDTEDLIKVTDVYDKAWEALDKDLKIIKTSEQRAVGFQPKAYVHDTETYLAQYKGSENKSLAKFLRNAYDNFNSELRLKTYNTDVSVEDVKALKNKYKPTAEQIDEYIDKTRLKEEATELHKIVSGPDQDPDLLKEYTLENVYSNLYSKEVSVYLKHYEDYFDYVKNVMRDNSLKINQKPETSVVNKLIEFLNDIEPTHMQNQVVEYVSGDALIAFKFEQLYNNLVLFSNESIRKRIRDINRGVGLGEFLKNIHEESISKLEELEKVTNKNTAEIEKLKTLRDSARGVLAVGAQYDAYTALVTQLLKLTDNKQMALALLDVLQKESKTSLNDFLTYIKVKTDDLFKQAELQVNSVYHQQRKLSISELAKGYGLVETHEALSDAAQTGFIVKKELSKEMDILTENGTRPATCFDIETSNTSAESGIITEIGCVNYYSISDEVIDGVVQSDKSIEFKVALTEDELRTNMLDYSGLDATISDAEAAAYKLKNKLSDDVPDIIVKEQIYKERHSVKTKPKTEKEVLKGFIDYLVNECPNGILMGHNIDNFDTEFVIKRLKANNMLEELKIFQSYTKVDTYTLFKAQDKYYVPDVNLKDNYEQAIVQYLEKLENISEEYDYVFQKTLDPVPYTLMDDLKTLTDTVTDKAVNVKFVGESVEEISSGVSIINDIRQFSQDVVSIFREIRNRNDLFKTQIYSKTELLLQNTADELATLMSKATGIDTKILHNNLSQLFYGNSPDLLKVYGYKYIVDFGTISRHFRFYDETTNTFKPYVDHQNIKVNEAVAMTSFGKTLERNYKQIQDIRVFQNKDLIKELDDFIKQVIEIINKQSFNDINVKVPDLYRTLIIPETNVVERFVIAKHMYNSFFKKKVPEFTEAFFGKSLKEAFESSTPARFQLYNLFNNIDRLTSKHINTEFLESAASVYDIGIKNIDDAFVDAVDFEYYTKNIKDTETQLKQNSTLMPINNARMLAGHKLKPANELINYIKERFYYLTNQKEITRHQYISITQSYKNVSKNIAYKQTIDFFSNSAEQIYSMLVYDSPVIAIKNINKVIEIEDYIINFLKRTDLEEYGIETIRTDTGLFLVLKDANKIVYDYDKTIRSVNAYVDGVLVKRVKQNTTFDITQDFKGLKTINETDGSLIEDTQLIDFLSKAYSNLQNLSNNKSFGTLNDIVSKEAYEGFYKKLPKEVQDKIDLKAYLNSGIFNETKYNTFNLGDTVSRRTLLEYTPGSIIQNCINSTNSEVLHVSTKYDYIDFMFDPDLKIKNMDKFKNNPETLLNNFKEAPEYRLVALMQNKKNPERLYITDITPKNLRDARWVLNNSDIDPIVVPYQMYSQLYEELNYNIFNNERLKHFRAILHLYKMGSLVLRGGMVVNNYIDSTTKEAIDLGSVREALQYQLKAVKAQKAYEEALSDIIGLDSLNIKRMQNAGINVEKFITDVVGNRGKAAQLHKLYNEAFMDLHKVPGAFEELSNVVEESLKDTRLDINDVFKKEHVLRYSTDNLDFYFKHINKTMTKEEFLTLHVFLTDGPTAGMLGRWKEYYRSFGTAKVQPKTVWGTIQKSIDVCMSWNQYVEQIVRLSEYLALLDQGLTAPAIYAKIANTHFDYAIKHNGLRVAELAFPFATYKMKNAIYWLDMCDKNPHILNLLRDVYSPIFNFDETDNEELNNNIALQNKISKAAVTLYQTKYIDTYGNEKVADFSFRVGPSFLDTLNMFLNPLENAKNSLYKPFNTAVDTFINNVIKDIPEEFIDRYIEANPGVSRIVAKNKIQSALTVGFKDTDTFEELTNIYQSLNPGVGYLRAKQELYNMAPNKKNIDTMQIPTYLVKGYIANHKGITSDNASWIIRNTIKFSYENNIYSNFKPTPEVQSVIENLPVVGPLYNVYLKTGKNNFAKTGNPLSFLSDMFTVTTRKMPNDKKPSKKKIYSKKNYNKKSYYKKSYKRRTYAKKTYAKKYYNKYDYDYIYRQYHSNYKADYSNQRVNYKPYYKHLYNRTPRRVYLYEKYYTKKGKNRWQLMTQSKPTTKQGLKYKLIQWQHYTR